VMADFRDWLKEHASSCDRGRFQDFDCFVPDYNAEAVVRLQRAGAIIFGKLATTEFATFWILPSGAIRGTLNTPPVVAQDSDPPD
jgi:hypothetical protein